MPHPSAIEYPEATDPDRRLVMSYRGDGTRRGNIILGVILVTTGLLAVAARQAGVDLLEVGWPAFVIVPGVLLFVGALFIGGRPGIGLAVPGGIVTVTGLVLAFQNSTGAWETWAYAWALVAPGGVGLGLFLFGLLTGQREVASAGLPVLATGLGLFFAFGFFFEGLLNLSGGRFAGFDAVFAGGLVVLGVIVLAFGLTSPRAPRA
jgi:hypothetical protein